MKFIDQVKLLVQAGKGGDGMIAFRREAHVDRGGPSGGDGGDGGSVYFVPDSGVNTLLSLHLKKTVKAEDGENGRIKNQYGAKGKDTFVKVPFGSVVYHKNKIIADIIEDRPYLIAQGGKGGRGNSKFKSSRNTAPEISEKGDRGQKMDIFINLKIMADAGLVGKPSAGKSTLLSRISNAKPKIADYTFTTLVPQLGLVKYFENSFVVADLPGLIKGASQGKGLGIRFLKHLERCRVLLHVIDFGDPNKDPITDYEHINQEIKAYNIGLENRAQIIIANKADLSSFQQHLKAFKAKYPSQEIITISALENDDFDTLKAKIFKMIEANKNPIIAKVKSEVTISLKTYFEVKKIHEGLFEIFGPEIEEIYHKIPLISHDNLMLFNRKLRQLGVWKALENQGVKKNDTVRIFDYEFLWEND
ncbi:GTPase ObgE [Mycoplasma iguanae]|uniref:GTPase Obg n=1 Tax=Mycoplasma iguanae TaxID=292461 RepID=A0ABY5RAN1_9MOLU|nr:GTPase ObgE [Mycoplasma iguanae]UVD81834.1 GTPase ObgE [Mycoplasma iguanae]